jgi:hypothetical protein
MRQTATPKWTPQSLLPDDRRRSCCCCFLPMTISILLVAGVALTYKTSGLRSAVTDKIKRANSDGRFLMLCTSACCRAESPPISTWCSARIRGEPVRTGVEETIHTTGWADLRTEPRRAAESSPRPSIHRPLSECGCCCSRW